MPIQVKEEKWEINIDDGDVTSTDPVGVAFAAAVVTAMHTFHEYLVPVGVSLVFSPEDTLMLYLYYTSSEAADDDPVDIIITDASRQNSRALLQRVRYIDCKFVDGSAAYLAEEDRCHLDVAPGEQIIVREGERIQIRAHVGAYTIDGSACYFQLTCKRIRHTLFG